MKTPLDTAPPPSSYAILRMLGWASIGGLAARWVGTDSATVLSFCFGGALAGIVLLAPLRWMLYLANPAVRKEHGYGGIRKAVGAGYLVMVPFAVLALVAELGFGWNALSAFALAGMMAGSGAAGMEVSRLGGKPLPNLLIGALHGFGLTMIWTFLMLAARSHG